MIHPISLVHVSIHRSAREVYAYVSDPTHLPQWASGLSSSSLKPADGAWVADSPMGKIRITFAPKNDLGVVDHDVTLPDGSTVHNPLRVQPNGSGADVIFTLQRLPKVTDQAFREDENHIRTDLGKLKSILEKQA